MIVTLLKIATVPAAMIIGGYVGGFVGALNTKQDFDIGPPIIGMGVGGIIGGTAATAFVIATT